MLVVAASGAWLYSHAVAEQRETQRKSLTHMAAAAASMVDVDLHKTFSAPAQETTTAYLGAIARLARLRNSNPDLKFVYTCVLRGDSVRFVLDAAEPGDHDGDGVDDKSHILQSYPDVGPACLKSLRTGLAAVDEEPYKDSWGTFISAYAPFFDNGGRQEGVVGVDMEIGRYLNELRGMRRAAAYGFLIAFLLSIASGTGVGFAFRYRLAADDQRQQAVEQLGAEKTRAEEATRAKSDFLATMSHEIRTPLNAIMGMLDLLLDHPLDPAQGQRVRTALASSEHLLVLLNDILDYSKMEAGRIDLESIPFDAAKVCQEVMTLLRGQAEEKGLHLTFSPHEDMHRAVIGDPARFRQVLINLVGNALKFTERGGVDVETTWRSTDETGGLLEVRVSDTGIGISADKQLLLFQKFSQADASTTRQYGGTGLGLAICKRLSEAMGGSIGVVSRPGSGSVFQFSLRLRWDRSPPAAGSDLALPGRDALHHGKSTFTQPSFPVLLVEDHPVNRLVAQQTLEGLGCRVEIAVNGLEAVEKAGLQDFAAVLMDCRMPEMDGYRAAKAIRALPGVRGCVPIIAITAGAEEQERTKCLEAGMDDFVSKPMRRQELAEVMRRWTATVNHDVLDGVTEAFGDSKAPFLNELIRLFLDSAPETLGALESALARGDGAAAARAAHTLHGAGAQMGATRLSSVCRVLEEAAAADKLDLAGEILAHVKPEFHRVGLELRKIARGENARNPPNR